MLNWDLWTCLSFTQLQRPEALRIKMHIQQLQQKFYTHNNFLLWLCMFLPSPLVPPHHLCLILCFSISPYVCHVCFYSAQVYKQCQHQTVHRRQKMPTWVCLTRNTLVLESVDTNSTFCECVCKDTEREWSNVGKQLRSMFYRTQAEISDKRISYMSHRQRRRQRRVVMFSHCVSSTRHNRACSPSFFHAKTEQAEIFTSCKVSSRKKKKIWIIKS